jgi:branched-chain amino acid transport system ATP-binding protein
MNPVLSVKDLHVSYGAIEAVKGISFDIFPGEVVSLIGANGAGKTTTLRAISHLLPSQGTILLNGQPTSKIPPHKLVSHGLVHSPEGRGIFLNLTVEENLKLGAFWRKDVKDLGAEMEICFKMFPRLQERLKASAGTLSGGEQQMLSILKVSKRAYVLETGKIVLSGEGRALLANADIQRAYLGH